MELSQRVPVRAILCSLKSTGEGTSSISSMEGSTSIEGRMRYSVIVPEGYQEGDDFSIIVGDEIISTR